MPTNLYGPGDNYDPMTSHVIPGLIHKFIVAKQTDAPNVTLWGTGSPQREFLYVDDLADACMFIMNHVSQPGPINVGSGQEVTIRQLAEMVREVVGYAGGIEWDSTKPDGTPRKLLDTSMLSGLGWRSATALRDGLSRAVADYLAR
jgi:GDP-L-fucose synthase